MPKFHIKLDLRDNYGPHQMERWEEASTPLEVVRRCLRIAKTIGDTVERITIDLRPGEVTNEPVPFE